MGRDQVFHHSQFHLVKSSGDILRSGCRAWSVSDAPASTGPKMRVQTAALWHRPQTSYRECEVWMKQSGVPVPARTEEIHCAHHSCLRGGWRCFYDMITRKSSLPSLAQSLSPSLCVSVFLWHPFNLLRDGGWLELLHAQTCFLTEHHWNSSFFCENRVQMAVM